MIFDEVRRLKNKDHITKMDKIRFLKQVPDFVFGTIDEEMKRRDDAWLDDQFQYYLSLYASKCEIKDYLWKEDR